MAGISHRDRGLRVHRWLGLAIGLFAVLLALSGMILACAPLIERIAAPARYRVSGDGRIAASAYVEAAHRRLRPGERIATLSLEQGASPVMVTLDRGGDHARRLLFLDPPTARVLASGWRDGGVIGAVRRVHDGLFLGGHGRWIVGVAGLGVMLASLTGFWPLMKRRPPKAKTRRPTHKGERAATWHRRVGLWSAIPVLAMMGSGVALAFSGGPTITAAAPPLARPALSVERVVTSARPWSRGTLMVIDWPTERSPDWTLHYRGANPMLVKVADDSATALAAPGQAAPAMLSWARRLHDGPAITGPWRVLVGLIGLLALWTAGGGLIAYAVRPAVRRARR
ncbi:PepSY domain-containing protein [uncultured Sphingomonas sp.]|uniref:PepSY-associated TM helix domain-containing protein n=1 Tax=uncultured Sphingomonas sp. TaxID=158754 RepID=UPI0025E1F652|nr:PepSY-associated TM helix domain-containing protein [uncultured Sphingomonas sp.]